MLLSEPLPPAGPFHCLLRLVFQQPDTTASGAPSLQQAPSRNGFTKVSKAALSSILHGKLHRWDAFTNTPPAAYQPVAGSLPFILRVTSISGLIQRAMPSPNSSKDTCG